MVSHLWNFAVFERRLKTATARDRIKLIYEKEPTDRFKLFKQNQRKAF